jgi:16S rRNA (cytosine967-C5)-methyltransferase
MDKRLATSIFYTALENRLKLDHALGQFVERMPDREIGCILHIAAAQLLMMDRIPDYAAVNAAVTQARALGREPYAKLVNGALRALIRARGTPAKSAGLTERPDCLPVGNASLPAPLARRLADDYGLEEAERIIAYRPAVRTETVRPNYLKMDDAAFEAYGRKKGWAMERATAPGAWHLTRAGDLTGDPEYKAGPFQRCRAKAQCWRRGPLSPVARQLSGRLRRAGGQVRPHRGDHAGDRPGAGLGCARASGGADPQHQKAAEAGQSAPRPPGCRPHREDLDGAFDGVLIDAPCSGLGVMHDKPDIKYRVTEEDLSALAALQRKILDACAPYVAPGGAPRLRHVHDFEGRKRAPGTGFSAPAPGI